MRSLVAILLTTVLLGCQDVSRISACRPDGEEVYFYENRSSGERMSVIRDGHNLLFDFYDPGADYRPSRISKDILETDGFFQIATLLVPKNFSDDSVSNATTVCRWRSGDSVEALYRIACKGSSEEAAEIVLFDIERGIVEWSTLNEDGSKSSDYLLQSNIGLLHACPA